MFKFLKTLFLLTLLFLVIYFYKDINNFIITTFIYNQDVVLEEPNEYYVEDNFIYVNETSDFIAKEKQDILDILYTALNSGYDSFDFYCDQDYETCIEDLRVMMEYEDPTASTHKYISSINNFIHPFNTFDTLYVESNTLGKVTVEVSKVYNEEDIVLINQRVDEIYNSIIANEMDLETKIKTIHDYLINNSKYDETRDEFYTTNNYYQYKSNIAYGTLLEGYAICGGYTDAMYLFLDKLDMTSMKVASENHIWNLININNEWKHLDLTWDDPVSSTGDDVLLDTFFLITTDELLEKDTENHTFDFSIYKELE